MFDHMMCKSPDVPLQDELFYWTFVAYGAFYLMYISINQSINQST